MPEELTAREVAERFSISRKTVQRRIADGTLVPSRKLPGTTGAYLFFTTDAERVFGRHDTEAVS